MQIPNLIAKLHYKEDMGEKKNDFLDKSKTQDCLESPDVLLLSFAELLAASSDVCKITLNQDTTQQDYKLNKKRQT